MNSLNLNPTLYLYYEMENMMTYLDNFITLLIISSLISFILGILIAKLFK